MPVTRLRASSRLRWLALGSLGSGCAAPVGDDVAVQVAAVVYGRDDRRDVFEEPDPLLRALAEDVAVALVRDEDVHIDGGAVAIDGTPASEVVGLCASERFAEQPAAARCSGVLVAPDLVLTAAHCLRAQPCRRLRIVRGYRYAEPGVLGPIAPDDVAASAEVIADATAVPDPRARSDVAWLRLDRALTATAGSPRLRDAAAAPPGAGMQVVLIGNGAGLPTKIDPAGAVVDPGGPASDHFIAAIDNFEGGSGAGVFDAQGALLGIASRGAADYEWPDGRCAVVRQLDVGAALEEVIHMQRALAVLCSAQPAAAPCARAAPPATCGAAAGRGRTSGAAAIVLVLAAALITAIRARPR